MNISLPTANILENGIKSPIQVLQAQRIATECDVLVTGRYFCDLILTGLPEMPRLGYEVWGKHCELVPGASFIPAVALHRLGLRVAWPCYFGNDLFSRFVREQARREGLNEAWFQEYDQPALGITISFSFTDERAFVSYTDEVPAPLYPDLIRQLHPRWVLLVNLWKGEKLAEVRQAALESHTAIFMDCQAHQASLDDPEVRSALQQVDVFSPNVEEALQLTGVNSVETALAKLAVLSPLVVIKLGRQGAIAQEGSQVVRVPGVKANVVDTTGAGDNFDCGFLYGQIQGYSLEDSLRCANICGGLSTEARGGSTASPTIAVVEKMRNLYRKHSFKVYK
jgi:sugar/nucleoside kinase (ribokinase family)